MSFLHTRSVPPAAEDSTVAHQGFRVSVWRSWGPVIFSASHAVETPQGHFFEENTKNLDSLDLLTNRLRSNAAQGHRCKRMKTPKITKNRPPGGLHGMAGAENNESPNRPPQTPLESGVQGPRPEFYFFLNLEDNKKTIHWAGF